MKVSLNYLKQYVDLTGLTPEEIAHRLTFAGVEVESIESLASGTNLVVGQVLTCENMPDSDHLHLTTVNAGAKYGVLNIVCGAPNVRKGLKVIVATDGAKLPGGTIKKGMVRGHTSEGMLCSLQELGVDAKFLSDAQKAGIEELPENAEVGNEDVLGLLGLDDVILDLKLLANRSDLYSLQNVAKEIQTLFGREAKPVEFDKVENAKLDFKVESLTDKCPQFSARVIRGVTIGESDPYLKRVLRASGIRSINNIVDVGNYIMLVTGQPLHMYDLDKLAKKELVVRDDLEKDFVALDDKTYKILPGDICITSNGEIMCLGGIMGSKACEVDSSTKNIVIEVANFDYASIRRTSIRLNLVSDSSQRFVKGINPNQYEHVLNLAASAVKKYCGGDEVGQIINYVGVKAENKVIESSVDYINNRLGTSFNKDEIVEALKAAFIDVKVDGDRLVCSIPDSRIDITGEADLSEEVIRIKGFEHVRSELPMMQLSVGQLSGALAKKRKVRDYLRGIGLDEALTYSLVSEKQSKSFRILNKGEGYKILNPLTDERAILRTNLLPSLFESLSYNLNHSNNNVAMFEVSDIFTEGASGKEMHLAIVLTGNDLRRGALSGEAYSYYHLKGMVDGILKLFDIDEKRAQLERANVNEFHPGKSAVLKIDGKVCAVFGELHPVAKKELGYDKENVIALEMNLNVVFDTKTSMKKMEQISRFPSVKRDFALVLEDKVTSKEVLTEVRKAGRDLIRKVEVFDVYKGEHVEEGHYSLAISVYIGSYEKTLTDSEIAMTEEAVVNALKIKFGAELRK